MKLTILRDNLLHGLKILKPAIGKGHLAILSNFLIKAENGLISLVGTNLLNTMNLTLGGKVVDDGAVTIPYQKFMGILNSLPSDIVEIRTTPKNVSIKCGTWTGRLSTLPAEEYPLIPELQTLKDLAESHFTLLGSDWLTMMGQVMNFASKESFTIAIHGALLDCQLDKTLLASTDCYRLAEKQLEIVASSPISVIIHYESLGAITHWVKACHLQDEEIVCLLNRNQLVLYSGQAVFVSQLTNGTYPDYSPICSVRGAVEMRGDSASLISALKRSKVVVADSSYTVRFESKDAELHVLAESTELGDTEDVLSVTQDTGELKMAINVNYMLDVLKHIPVQYEIKWDDPVSPIRISPVGDDSVYWILMPMHYRN